MSTSVTPVWKSPTVSRGVARAPAELRECESALRAVGTDHIRPGVWLTLILVLAAAMRLYGLDREGFWGDEYAQVSQYAFPPHYTVYHALKYHAFGPIDFLVGWVAYRISPSVWMLRLPAAMWGIASVALCYLLVKRLASWREGLVAAALLGLCPLQLVLSQEVRPYSVCLAFLLMTLVLFLRAHEKPSAARVAAFGIVAYLSTLTRTFTPAMFLLVIGGVLTAALLSSRSSGLRRQALRRLWLATLLAGLAALPMVAILIHWDEVASFADAPTPNFNEVDVRPFHRIVDDAATLARAMIGSYGPLVLGLAVAGVIMVVRGRRQHTTGQRCAWAIMILIAPVFLLIYVKCSGLIAMKGRYAFSFMPIIAALAALPTVAVWGWIRQSSLRSTATRGVLCGCVGIAILAYPAVMSADEMAGFRRRDWRGLAAYLEGRAADEDVAMVLTEIPFGQNQSTFFSKYDRGLTASPLAHPLWVFAYSDTHFEKLLARPGRCYLVIAYPTPPQRRDDYLSTGLTAAPDGMELVKFRGLDLVFRNTASLGGPEAILSVLDDMLAIPRRHPSTNAIPLSLKARMLLRMGNKRQAAEAFRTARGLVPDMHRPYFDRATASWASVLPIQ